MVSKEHVKEVCVRIFKANNVMGAVYSDNQGGGVRVLIEAFDGTEEQADKVSHEIKKKLGQNTTVFI